MVRILLLLTALVFLLPAPGPGAPAEPAVNAKQFPAGLFLRFGKVSPKEKEKMLENLAAALARLNQEGYGLIAKGAVIGGLPTDVKTHPRLTILDDSGLIIIARRVPNLYYRYRGKRPPNPNTYLVLKNLRVNEEESHRRPGLVVEGDFVAYAAKFVTAIMEGWERAAEQEDRQPQEIFPDNRGKSEPGGQEK